MVDVDQVEARLQRLEELLEQLEAVQKGGEQVYLGDAQLRAATERQLQLAIQVCIDLGAQIVSELSAPPPSSYSEVFETLGEKGVISTHAARHLAAAARQRNLLVHLYMEIDDRAVFASLAYLDDLREFAVAVERLARG